MDRDDERKVDLALIQSKTACFHLFQGNLVDACNVGAEIGIHAYRKQAMKTREPARARSLSGASLGFFHPCDEPCPKGTEKVVLRRFTEKSRAVLRHLKTGKGKAVFGGEPAICICRLDPSTRKKFRDEKIKVTREYERGLKPFGTEEKPVHLRRCYQVDDRGRCIERGRPIVRAHGKEV